MLIVQRTEAIPQPPAGARKRLAHAVCSSPQRAQRCPQIALRGARTSNCDAACDLGEGVSTVLGCALVVSCVFVWPVGTVDTETATANGEPSARVWWASGHALRATRRVSLVPWASTLRVARTVMRALFRGVD